MTNKISGAPARSGIREQLNAIAARRIIILDGAMGSLIQSYRLGEKEFRGGRFAGHPVNLLGCNDLLCLTRPELISAIHESYLEAGADITKTCSFNATAVSLEHFGLEGLAYEISRASAELARQAADRFSRAGQPRFVAGSMGPTAKSGSLSPDINRPEKRAVSWDELASAYYDNARGLLDGGADILLVETIIDTLNAKAAIFAVHRLMEERGVDLPLMLSATVANAVGSRILAGQTLGAFCVSVAHANPWALGLNCSFGAETLKNSVAELGALSGNFGAPWLISAHPNAGLPNALGLYDESPESMAAKMEPYFKESLVNIAGGCCGTTPAHIAALAETAKRYPPRESARPAPPLTRLSNLVDFALEKGPCLIGDRSNAAENREFLKYLQEENYDDALAEAAGMIEGGASIIDVRVDEVCEDAGSPEGEGAMRNFLNFIPQDPDLARTPVMIDSSRWSLIEAGLACVQGKSLVYSISLEEGPEEFLRRAGIIRSRGAAAVVRLRDERGPARDYEQKIETARRSWDLLRASGFPAQDTVFDPGLPGEIEERDPRLAGFIRACAWIRENCPGAQVLGVLSALGAGPKLRAALGEGEEVQRALNAVFLERAVDAGLGMAVVNPAALAPRAGIATATLTAAEKALFG
jgi:5-methyltetrahydrofolate--homocysteine methyltransferase